MHKAKFIEQCSQFDILRGLEAILFQEIKQTAFAEVLKGSQDKNRESFALFILQFR